MELFFNHFDVIIVIIQREARCIIMLFISCSETKKHYLQLTKVHPLEIKTIASYVNKKQKKFLEQIQSNLQTNSFINDLKQC
jgi:mannitol/fructose-specific phosphotransferase system IIA component (Ntr-type)